MDHPGAATGAFFERLATGTRDDVLGSVHGTIRFDLEDGGHVEHYRVVVRRDSIAVDRSPDAADCVVRTTVPVFDRVAGGHLNALPAALRGLLDIEGDPGLLIRFQRLFPAAEDRTAPASARTVGRQRS
jgi:putative sterol carrier protein